MIAALLLVAWAWLAPACLPPSSPRWVALVSLEAGDGARCWGLP